ncbi:phosphatidate cytidylyltransferase [Pseudomaricurvus alcaniphilus]|nr:phosphatidate cytidylyltransferase [Pseudomaricurvus alcaniphilus]
MRRWPTFTVASAVSAKPRSRYKGAAVLKQRVITAIILAACFLLALFALPLSGFALALALVVMLAGWEWANLAGFEPQWQRCLYALLVGLVAAGLAYYTHLLGGEALALDRLRDILLLACGWWALALLWVQGYPASAVLWDRRWLKAIMGIVVLVPAWLALVYLHSQEYGQWLVVLVMVAVACADIGAYFSGKAFGKHKLAPNVSPGKSWEGFWGGLGCCLLLAALIGYSASGGWLVFAVIVPASLVSVLGDLSESMLKRQRGIKDSSQLLPGHGGLLDRIDGVTAAAPVFALAILLSGWSF